MILVYRPELESPPMDKECTIGFSFVQSKGQPENIQVESGVNRDFPEDVWEKIQDYDVVKNMLKLGALRVETEQNLVQDMPAANVDTISDMPVNQAMRLVEDSFDIAQLQRWEKGEQRIRVRNSISKRISAITEGNG
ncbi:MAG: hypothetical protein ACO3TI_03455 [Aquiluna sp.]|jgi:hypothetical protein